MKITGLGFIIALIKIMSQRGISDDDIESVLPRCNDEEMLQELVFHCFESDMESDELLNDINCFINENARF